MTDKEKLKALEQALKEAQCSSKKVIIQFTVNFIIFAASFAAGILIGSLLL